MTSVQDLVAQLQVALGLHVTCGVIALNMNEGQVASVETRIKVKVPQKRIDRRAGTTADLTR